MANASPRLRELKPAELTPAQKTAYDAITAELGNAFDGGPYPILLYYPGVAEGALRILKAFRIERKIDRKLYELAVLVVAKEWASEFEWRTHEPRAVAAGLKPEVCAALRAGTLPAFTADDERVVYAVTKEMMATRALSQATHDEAARVLGTDKLVELVSAIGFYTMLAITLAAFAP